MTYWEFSLTFGIDKLFSKSVFDVMGAKMKIYYIQEFKRLFQHENIITQK